MDIFGVGVGELLVILVIAMMVVGPERMVELAGELGRFLRRFRSTTEEVTREFREAFTLEMNEAKRDKETPKALAQRTAAQNQQAKSGGKLEPTKPTKVGDVAEPRTAGAPVAVPAVAGRAEEARDDQAASGADDGKDDTQGAAQSAKAAEGAEPQQEAATQPEEPEAGAPQEEAASKAEEASEAERPIESEEPVEEIGDLSDLLGSAFALSEHERQDEEHEEQEAAAVTSPAAEVQGVTQDDTALAEAEADTDRVREEASRAGPPAEASESSDEEEAEDADDEGEGTGLSAPIPTFGLDLGLEESSEVSGSADRSGKEG